MTSIETLRAVYHPTRRRIIDWLAVNGASQVTQLASAFDEQVGSISHHLRMLEKVSVVERAPELATDGRTSWWRLTGRGNFAWSVDDFAGNLADRIQAKSAERLHIDHQLGKLSAWKRTAEGAAPEWRAAAFNTSTSARANAEELGRLQEMLQEATRAWKESIDLEDGREREPVFVFVHGFPSQP